MKLKILVGFTFVAVVLGMIYFAFFTFLNHTSVSIYMFADLEECRQLKNVVTEYTEIDVATDKYLKNIKYKECVAASCKAEDYEFRIYAYVFESETVAENYYKSVDERGAPCNPCFFGSSGWGSYRLVVLDGNKAYVVLSKSGYGSEVAQVLSKVFSVTVDEGF